MLRYEFYKNWGSEHYWVELQENQISCTTLKDKKPTHTTVILLQDIETIKLTKEESWGNVSYTCDIKSKDGDFITFCTWGEEKNHKEYLQFIIELHKNCATYPHIEFKQPFEMHKNPLQWAILLILVIIIGIAWWYHYEPIKNNIVFIGIVLNIMGWLLRNTLNDSYQAKQIPKELLPIL